MLSQGLDLCQSASCRGWDSCWAHTGNRTLECWCLHVQQLGMLFQWIMVNGSDELLGNVSFCLTFHIMKATNATNRSSAMTVKRIIHQATLVRYLIFFSRNTVSLTWDHNKQFLQLCKKIKTILFILLPLLLSFLIQVQYSLGSVSNWY